MISKLERTRERQPYEERAPQGGRTKKNSDTQKKEEHFTLSKRVQKKKKVGYHPTKGEGGTLGLLLS